MVHSSKLQNSVYKNHLHNTYLHIHNRNQYYVKTNQYWMGWVWSKSFLNRYKRKIAISTTLHRTTGHCQLFCSIKMPAECEKFFFNIYIFINIYIILYSGSRTQEHKRQTSVIYEPSLMFARNIFPPGDFCIKPKITASCHHLFCTFSFAKNSSSVSW